MCVRVRAGVASAGRVRGAVGSPACCWCSLRCRCEREGDAMEAVMSAEVRLLLGSAPLREREEEGKVGLALGG